MASTSRGMSFPLISCNRTSGIRRGGLFSPITMGTAESDPHLPVQLKGPCDTISDKLDTPSECSAAAPLCEQEQGYIIF